MHLTITTTHKPATDLGYLLVKNPSRAQQFELPFGTAHVTYPEASEERCTVALTLDINPVALVRGREGSQGGGTLDAYVNNRPYVACSFMSVSIRQVFGSALSGKNKDRPDLARTAIPLECRLSALPSRHGPDLIHRLFEPLGYTVACTRHPLDPQFPEWGDSACHTVTLTGQVTLQSLLTHLFVLIPVIDNDKHYFVGDDEVTKLLKHGSGWLAEHPARELIAKRYLGYNKNLEAKALAQLEAQDAEEEEPTGEEENEGNGARQVKEQELEKTLSLHDQRHQAVFAALKDCGARSAIDMGCGEGKFLKLLLGDQQFERIIGVDLSVWRLEKTGYKLKLRKLDEAQRRRIRLVQGSATYRDATLRGYDAAVCIEMIEHIDLPKLDTFATVVFGDVAPRVVVITTPNVEYNPKFVTLPAGQFRHKDHRFEWTRAEFQSWCGKVAEQYGYDARYLPVGPEDAEVGAPSQMAVFEKLTETELGSERKEKIAAATAIFDKLPAVESMLRGRKLDTELVQNIFIRPANAQAAFEKLNSYGVDPRWLIYVPPTMSPCSTSDEPGTLEYPDEAFNHYQKHGVREVVCEQKHMGSRAVVIVCRTAGAAARRFGIESPAGGVCYTRMGRPFFTDGKLEADFLQAVRHSLTRCGFWDKFATDWVALDCELMPWSAKAQDLIRRQYADVGAAALASLPAAVADMERVKGRGQDVGAVVEQMKARLECASLFRQAYRQYCWPVSSLADYRLAPFHILASEGAVHTDRDHVWHMETLKEVAAASDGMIIATPYRVVDLTNDEDRQAAIAWWEELTGAGGEGMVVKPLTFTAFDDQGLLQPAVKCRGREYLRIIYGPDYTLPHHLERLRERGLGTKRALALREFALGVESLERFVRGDSLASVHECAFAVLALETEACDPRL